MGYSTEELWFSEWENGGTPYDKPENYEKFNPVNHVDEVEERRCWWSTAASTSASRSNRASSTFTALQRRGIESQFLLLPGREPLGAQAAEQRAVAQHGRRVDQALDGAVVRE